MYTRAKILLLAPLLLATSAMATPAAAQSFTYQPLDTLKFVPVTLDDDQWVHDVFASQPATAPGPGPRYAPNLHHRFRVIGNPFIRGVGIVYDKLDLNPIVVGGMNDTLDFRWYDGSGTPVTRTGLWSSGTQMWVSPHGDGPNGNSLMRPGARLTFRSGPSWDGTGTHIESEESGFRSSDMVVWGSGATGFSVTPTLTAHERVMGVLLGNDDVVDMRLPAHVTPVTATLWLEQPDTWGVEIWARCGSLPTTTAFDQKMSTAPSSSFPNWHGARLDLPPCAGGWYISVTNTGSTDRVFHLLWGTHYAERELRAMRIGIAFDATSAQLATIHENFRTAAWLFYAMTHGSWLIRDFRVINNAHQCDDAWPVDQFACEGTGCRFCLVDVPSGVNNCRSMADSLGKISLCSTTGWDSPQVIVHELGHAILGLPDEYHDTSSDCPHPRSWPLCWHSMMSGYQTYSFCNDIAHRTAQEDWRGLLGTTQPWAPVSNGPVAYDCYGNSFWTNASSMWSVLNTYAPFALPADWSPHNRRLLEFTSDQMVGSFSRTR